MITASSFFLVTLVLGGRAFAANAVDVFVDSFYGMVLQDQDECNPLSSFYGLIPCSPPPSPPP
eukprot:CAMPEP_0114312628 /NCGR_PEP_ID=MMETSP0059-20121206/20570_1 /TAXON_ID=36894 /ORGANISM="Pyramimonas parkeae, Strain CCMP726" /LENGTH=62 /DNA_ID=CAMNT_0001437103 /DNA_START=122 /DNA_END=306 /DNA_ORIENTATION=+